MKTSLVCHMLRGLAAVCVLTILSVSANGQTPQSQSGPPSVAPPLVREGDFAIDLQQALQVGTSNDEVEAENKLSELGIAPRNGWIADYPVTPDIIGEIQQALSNAASAGKLPMSADEARSRLRNVNAKEGLAVSPYAGTQPSQAPPAGAENYPNPTVVNNYYYNEGPPVVTYYNPPPDYYYLYTWVPYPFFSFGFFFPGFFVLHDFHRHVFVHGRPVFVSNHFNDIRVHRVFRIDPRNRFDGRTFAGIGASHRRDFIGTGVPRSETRIFNAPRNRPMPGFERRGFEGRGLPQRSFGQPGGGFGRGGMREGGGFGRR